MNAHPPSPYKLHPNLYELTQVRFGTLLGIKEFQLRYKPKHKSKKKEIKAQDFELNKYRPE